MSGWNESTLQARVIVDELIRHGMTDVVLCPGSRSGALAFACSLAARQQRLRLHVRIDERSAGFVALGLAVAQGRPVAVVCTSGSAAANLHPAAVEARYSGVPVVFLTANRPAEMQGVGATQTINQQGIFAHDVVAEWCFPPAAPGWEQQPQRWNALWRSTVSRVMVSARHHPGPVHCDVSFREPLVPEQVGTGQVGTVPLGMETELPDAWQGRQGGAPWTAYSEPTVDLSRPTLVIAGQGSWECAALAGVPTLCEPGGQTVGWVLSPLVAEEIRPEQIIVVGRPTLHRPVMRLLAQPDVDQIVMAPSSGVAEWADVSGCARVVATSVSVVGECAPSWIEECRQADVRARGAVAGLLHEEELAVAEGAEPSGLAVANEVGRVVAEQSGVQGFVGSSQPVRDVALTHPELGPRWWVNRGAAGIDGNCSTVVGLALATGAPVVALVGDLTALHDVGGLLVPSGEETPHQVTIVVANDDGGGIFSTLEQGDPCFAESFERVFAVPHGVAVSTLAAGWGVSCQCCTLPELAEVLRHPTPGIRVVEVRTRRDQRRRHQQQLRGRAR